MIIQCQECQTKFRLDDSRVTDKGVKVRCTKCKHVFTVRKEEAESGEPEGALTGFASPDEQIATAAVPPEEQSFAPESTLAAPFDSETFEETSPRSEPADFSSLDTSFFDDSAISFGPDKHDTVGTENIPASADEPAVKVGEVDFSGFDFGTGDSEPDLTSLTNDFVDTTPAPAQVNSPKDAPPELDFSDDDMFGSVVQTAPEASNSTISFDFADDTFSESMDMSGPDSGGKGDAPLSLDATGDTPFNPGEIDFGDETATVAHHQTSPIDLKPSRENLSSPRTEVQNKPASELSAESFHTEGSGDVGEQELPPLSIASRRKQSPIFGVLIAIIAVLVVSVLGFLGYSSLSTPKEAAVPETGKITVRTVKAAFVKNEKAGELLVISGEALNEYPKARAALQVKVTVFDNTGQSVATKSAYDGNPLTKEQLESLPLEKIEAAMANQFGDSLANMEVAPGKAIPFVVVLANIPKDAKEFAVQSTGSTVATGKQQ